MPSRRHRGAHRRDVRRRRLIELIRDQLEFGVRYTTVKIVVETEQQIDIVEGKSNDGGDGALVDREFRVADAVRVSVNGGNNRD